MTINIKPENRGKFNATKKRTGKTTEELTHSKNPLTRKRAIFAQNAAKWRHELGGYLLPKGELGIDLSKYITNMALGAAQNAYGANSGEVLYNSSMGAISNAGPIGAAIGGITKIGDSIGDPIRNSAERTNELNGGLTNKNKAINSAQAGMMLNPFKGMTMTLGDKNASNREKRLSVLAGTTLIPGLSRMFGKERAKRIDTIGKETFNKEFTDNINLTFGNYMNDQIKYLKYGGNFLSKNIVDYKGATHSQGGIKVDKNGNPTSVTGKNAIAEIETGEVKWGDYIFSNKISYGKK